MELKVRNWRALFPGACVSCVLAVLLCVDTPVAGAQDYLSDPCMWLMKCETAHPSAEQPNGPRGPDPCYLAQNALRPCTSEQQQTPAQPVGLDPNVVGTWELAQKGGKWVLEIHRDGTYKFHSEAADGVAPNAGSFSASSGRWSLKATNGYADGGTYLFQGTDTWIATGKLGAGAWRLRSTRASVARK
jgi:hypothetical protein